MGYYKLVTMTCDDCLTPYETSESTVSDARRDAAFEGWRHRNGRDLCGRCADTVEPPEQVEGMLMGVTYTY